MDCEGGEVDLLQPDLAPNLRYSDVLVELHDFLNPTISETILSRFRGCFKRVNFSSESYLGRRLHSLKRSFRRSKLSVVEVLKVSQADF